MSDEKKPQQLHVLLLGGRAFAHDPNEGAAEGDGSDVAEDGAPGGAGAGAGSSSSSSSSDTLCACLHFGGQRFRSKPVPFCAEPELRDGVLLELPAPDATTPRCVRRCCTALRRAARAAARSLPSVTPDASGAAATPGGSGSDSASEQAAVVHDRMAAGTPQG